MAIVDRLARALARHQVPYDVMPFREAFTAQQSARNAHVRGGRFAKVLILRDEGGRDFMVVLPASRQFQRHAVREATGRLGTRLEDEAELRRLFPDCELGAMPPFGALWDLPMWVDPCLASGPEIWFEAGNHHELVHMRWDDYARVAAPFEARECLHGLGQAAYAG